MYVGDNEFFFPEDPISLSLEYYQARLDKTDVNSNKKVVRNGDANKVVEGESEKDADGGSADEHLPKNDRKYLQCPAAVKISYLQKFIRMKFGLTSEHKVSTRFACKAVGLAENCY